MAVARLKPLARRPKQLIAQAIEAILQGRSLADRHRNRWQIQLAQPVGETGSQPDCVNVNRLRAHAVRHGVVFRQNNARQLHQVLILPRFDRLNQDIALTFCQRRSIRSEARHVQTPNHGGGGASLHVALRRVLHQVQRQQHVVRLRRKLAQHAHAEHIARLAILLGHIANKLGIDVLAVLARHSDAVPLLAVAVEGVVKITVRPCGVSAHNDFRAGGG